LQHIKKKYEILIGSSSAEQIKIKIGNAYPDEEIQTIEAKGRDLTTGIPKILILDSDEIRDVISEQVNTIIGTVRIALEQISPELAADLIDKGIVMTGGGSMLKNLDVLLREQIKLPIKRTSDPLTDVAVGSGKALSNLSVLSKVAI
jgi:rod shape-determining protein MreB